MAQMKGNPYAERYDKYWQTSDPHELTDVAIMALAYEQRTANLIERERLLEQFHGYQSGRSMEYQIHDRLGEK